MIVDTLLSLDIKVKKIFVEHGFRGIADAGQNVETVKILKQAYQ